MTLAARASVRLLDRALLLDPGVPPRRVVVVAEVGSAEPAPDVDRAAVRVLEPVTTRLVKAVHVEEGDRVAGGTLLWATPVIQSLDLRAAAAAAGTEKPPPPTIAEKMPPSVVTTTTSPARSRLASNCT